MQGYGWVEADQREALSRLQVETVLIWNCRYVYTK